MIKNKDGSYNKFSLLILSIIIIIGIGIIGSLLITENQTIDITSLVYIGLIISGGLTIYYGKKVFFKSKPNITYMMQTSTPIISKQIHDHIEIEKPIILPKPNQPIHEKIEIINTPELIKEPVQRGPSINFISIFITLIITIVTMIVGLNIAKSVANAMPELPAGSPLATSQTEVMNTFTTVFNIIPLLIIVGVIIMIIPLFKFMRD